MTLRRDVCGVLLLDKPRGLTSNAALQRVKRLYRAVKAGHGGTLDPLASGLLPVLFGEATKFAGRLLDSDKSYLARVKLGETTATGDAEGEVLETRPVDVDDGQVEAALRPLRGESLQIPPMFSALKHAGQPLYRMAREGVVVERAPRTVHVRELVLLRREGEFLDLSIRCSKGTYVRALAVDIGAALGTGAHLAGLRRTGAGGFSVEEALGPEALEALCEKDLASRLISLERLFSDLPRVDLDAHESARFRNGQALKKRFDSNGLCGVFSEEGKLMGLGTLQPDGSLRALRLCRA